MATESDKVNVGAIATLVAVGAIGLVAIVGVLTAIVRQELAADQERKGGTVNTRPYRDLQAAQLAELTEEATWLDKNSGVLSIPVDRAMEIVVDELRQDAESATPPAPADGGLDAVVVDAGAPDDAATQDGGARAPGEPGGARPLSQPKNAPSAPSADASAGVGPARQEP